MTDDWWRLRPGEVAGTGDPHAERLTELLRERFGDAYKDMLIPVDPKARPMQWSDFLPPQDAPALGFRTQPLIGAEAVQDVTPPTVTKPDLQADLVKAYKLIRDAPYQRRDMGDPRWHRFEAITAVDADDATRTGSYAQLLEETLLALTTQAREKLEAAVLEAQRAGCTLCVHEGPTAMVSDPPSFDMDSMTVKVRIRAHMLWPGQVCEHLPRTQYGEQA